MKKNSKDHILKTSFRLFLSKSYEQVTVRDIEKATSLSRGAVFYYFQNKEDLFKATIDYCILHQQTLQKTQLSQIHSFRDFIHYYIKITHSRIEEIKETILNVTTQSASKAYLSLRLQINNYYPGFDERARLVGDEEIEIWKRFIQKAILDQEIRPECNPQLLAEQFKAIFIGESYLEALKAGIETKHLEISFMHLYSLIRKTDYSNQESDSPASTKP